MEKVNVFCGSDEAGHFLWTTWASPGAGFWNVQSLLTLDSELDDMAKECHWVMLNKTLCGDSRKYQKKTA